MAKKLVTLKFLGSKVNYFMVVKAGSRGMNDSEELLRQFARSPLGTPAHMSQDDQSGLLIFMSLAPGIDQMKALRQVWRCFVKAGYRIRSLPRY
jgi:hypothetical protein